MKSRTLTFVIAITLFAALAPLRLAAQKQIRYTVTDLGTLGGTFSLAGGINNKSEVVGFSTLRGDTQVHAFLWRSGVMTDLQTLGGPNSIADFSLAERGEVAGRAETSTPDPLGEDPCGFGTFLICLPFVWQKGVMTPLPTLGGDNGIAHEINNRGQVAGLAENTTQACPPPNILEFEPVIWEKGEIQELPTIAGDPDGVATAINDKGQAVGQTGDCIRPFHTVLWHNGMATDMGTLGGLMLLPFDIDNQAQVVGLAFSADGTTNLAFLWQDGVATSLGTLAGDVASEADGINSKGQVVGGSFDKDGNGRAFLWQNGVMTDLNTLIPASSPLFLIEALGAVNSRGQIAGIALQISTGEAHAFLATPIHGNESAALAVPGSPSTRAKVVVPENVRKMLQQRLGNRYHIPGLRGSPRD